ncbi:MAG: hypothetical protein DRR16_11535 [Candidatus Parabeggiatoa sp. nov. 3]|nr:MAG: hypothetical protein DRR00_06570 [Gammaproteobacteria bacterium]RKZ66390.1 MAG: hypothetical protein DRQ99_09890 [Gammaproteobacteria bacterium]RKZ85677.1 MAG: hypothetical protein DRR16_11535 [Gammaproteobacteria bacterium]
MFKPKLCQKSKLYISFLWIALSVKFLLVQYRAWIVFLILLCLISLVLNHVLQVLWLYPILALVLIIFVLMLFIVIIINGMIRDLRYAYYQYTLQSTAYCPRCSQKLRTGRAKTMLPLWARLALNWATPID